MADPAAPYDLAELVAVAAGAAPQRPALVEVAGRRLSWAELDGEVARVASGLGRLGVVAGHRVLFALGNRAEFVTVHLGVLRAQAVAVPVNPRSTPGELARMVADSGARVVVVDASSAGAAREAVATLAAGLAGRTTDLDAGLLARAVVPRVVVVGDPAGPEETSYAEVAATEPRPVPPLPDPEKLAALLYTSGTSGLPRAAMLTHRAMLANIAQVAEVHPPMVREDDVVLGVLPLFHVYGLNAVLGAVLGQRATLVLAEHVDAGTTLDLVAAHGCTVVPVAPPVLNRWASVPDLAERLAGVRLVVSGSAPLAAEVVEEVTARSGVPVHQGYGLTEAAPVVTSTLCSRHPVRGSVGAPLPGVSLRLRADVEDPGEIEISGPNLFSGYWPDGAGGPGDGGWWATGDVGVLDPGGDLTLVDRVKELVIVSGFNVYPVEVEEVIREVPGVAEVAVIGVEDEHTGEAVVAWVRAPGQDPAAVADAVRAHCAGRLARFKQPTRVEVVEQLPVTGTGKVQKGRLRGMERRRRHGLLD
ncbi:class I adenylate-forming enzyme family protein [Nocardioides panaciterrulae]|uniref:Long-chain acyl-CoA synthetase n=1 Tax=Nocardioides panaciterrulae TaxID=661492 RepID=A0A7Y9E9C2_9ACTN|nr:class I adenylate-forming enzyme family protein [Nocardioides panaciterrulae]NYD43499.1 long-chain acyl-CoA synthetase [Nocardioides panaciterrulae]